MKKLLLILLFAFSAHSYGDEFIELPSPESGMFASSAPTRAMFWFNPDTKGTIISLPGGDGSFNLTRPRSRPVRGFGLVTTALLDPNSTSGKWNVAFLDSHVSLGLQHYPSARFTDAHLNRVASLIRYIKEKTKKPVWVWGHSNGTITAFNIYTHLAKTNEQHLIDGIIASGARDVIKLPDTVNVPVQFIHHQYDACNDTPYSTAQRNYEKLKTVSTSRIEFSTITSPTTVTNGHPCFTGTHMFDGMYVELAQAIDSFVNK